MTDLSRRWRRLASALTALQLALAAGAATAYADTASQYIYISKQTPQHLYLIDDGHILFQSPVNTGVRAAPTPDGRFRIFASVRRRTMRGTDPRTGRRYNDPNVPYVMYFDGGKAIHGFYRRGYGYPQSLGCIELPVYKARELYQLLDGGVGTEVVVAYNRPRIEYASRQMKAAPSHPEHASHREYASYPSYPFDPDYSAYRASDGYLQEAMPE